MDAQKAPRGQRQQSQNLGETGNVPLLQWARIVGVKDSYAYEQSRHNRIAGRFKVGNFVRVHLPTFYKAQGIDA